MKGLISAVSPEGAIGLAGTLPWNHPGDMRRFQRVTRGGVVIMGRLTWESMTRKPLPARRNVVIARVPQEGVETYSDIAGALAAIASSEPNARDVWFIGGAAIYAEALKHADLIDVTYVPNHVTDPAAVHFPFVDLGEWEAGPLIPHEDEPALSRRVFMRRPR